MEVLLQDLGAWRSHATKLYGGLSSLYNQTPMTTTTTTAAAAATPAAAAAAFLKYHHSLITLSHPLRLRPLLLQTHATRSSFLPQPTETTFPSTERNFPPTHPQSWLHCFFSNLPPFFSNLPPSFQTYRGRGGRSRDRGSGGVILFLRKSLPPLGWTPPLFYFCGLEIFVTFEVSSVLLNVVQKFFNI